MNINHDIVARALNKAGQEPLTDTEWKEKTSTRYRLIYQYYITTILETLSNTDWTSQKKRTRLVLSEEENLTTFEYMYILPIDCRKAVALMIDADYMVEDGFLYTNQKDAALCYISDGFTGEYEYKKAEPQPTTEEEFSQDNYYVKDEESGKFIHAESFEEETAYYVIVENDYNFYKEINLDPLLSEYIETRLAAKIVLKLSGDTKLYQLLYSESQLMEQRAVKATSAHNRNKESGNRYWSEILGLPDEEDI